MPEWYEDAGYESPSAWWAATSPEQQSRNWGLGWDPYARAQALNLTSDRWYDKPGAWTEHEGIGWLPAGWQDTFDAAVRARAMADDRPLYTYPNYDPASGERKEGWQYGAEGDDDGGDGGGGGSGDSDSRWGTEALIGADPPPSSRYNPGYNAVNYGNWARWNGMWTNAGLEDYDLVDPSVFNTFPEQWNYTPTAVGGWYYSPTRGRWIWTRQGAPNMSAHPLSGNSGYGGGGGMGANPPGTPGSTGAGVND